jgi:hypothetical protein
MVEKSFVRYVVKSDTPEVFGGYVYISVEAIQGFQRFEDITHVCWNCGSNCYETPVDHDLEGAVLMATKAANGIYDPEV